MFRSLREFINCVKISTRKLPSNMGYQVTLEDPIYRSIFHSKVFSLKMVPRYYPAYYVDDIIGMEEYVNFLIDKLFNLQYCANMNDSIRTMADYLQSHLDLENKTTYSQQGQSCASYQILDFEKYREQSPLSRFMPVPDTIHVNAKIFVQIPHALEFNIMAKYYSSIETFLSKFIGALEGIDQDLFEANANHDMQALKNYIIKNNHLISVIKSYILKDFNEFLLGRIYTCLNNNYRSIIEKDKWAKCDIIEHGNKLYMEENIHTIAGRSGFGKFVGKNGINYKK